MILEALLSNWKLVLIVALLTACGMYRSALLSEETSHAVDLALHAQLVRNAKTETQKAKDRNAQTVKEINDEKPKLVAQAERNAAELYRRRFGNSAGASACGTGNPVRGIGIGGVPNVSRSDSTGTIQADSAARTERAPPVVDAGGTCNPRFLNEAARAAVVIKLWNDWADKEGLPREQ